MSAGKISLNFIFEDNKITSGDLKIEDVSAKINNIAESFKKVSITALFQNNELEITDSSVFWKNTSVNAKGKIKNKFESPEFNIRMNMNLQNFSEFRDFLPESVKDVTGDGLMNILVKTENSEIVTSGHLNIRQTKLAALDAQNVNVIFKYDFAALKLLNIEGDPKKKIRINNK